MPKIPSHVSTLGDTELLDLRHCEKCNRITVWIIFEHGRLCMGHSRGAMTKEQIQRAEQREYERRNPKLF